MDGSDDDPRGWVTLYARVAPTRLSQSHLSLGLSVGASPLSAHGWSGGNKGVYAEVQWPGVGLGALNVLSIRYDMQYGVWGVRALGHFTDHSGFLLDAT